jgi:hypothetical protein
VEQFRHLEKTITNQNSIHKEIKSRQVRECLLLFAAESFVLCGYETWSLTLREEHRLRVFENRVLRKTFGPMMDEVTGEEKTAY